MTTTNEKTEILESLEALDDTQAEKVLMYIKSMLFPSKDEEGYRKFKQQAMVEIRQALGNKEINLVS